MRYIVAVDIGGTTFNTGLFSDSFNQIDISAKDKIRNYSENKSEVVNAIVNQIDSLIKKNKLSRKQIIGLGIASPGPLDPVKGRILNTPNLKVFKNFDIANDFAKKLKIDTYLENDANLFAMGEWFTQYRKNSVMLGMTLGTGLGFGLILNNKLFTGGNGMAMEYGLSPFEWGLAEENASIRFLRKRSKIVYGKEISPRLIEKKYFEKDDKAICIYNEFGENLGMILSHVINMVDPQVITIGGGLSKAFKCFEQSMRHNIKKHAPSYEKNNIIIAQSKFRELSTMIGACIMVKNENKL